MLTVHSKDSCELGSEITVVCVCVWELQCAITGMGKRVPSKPRETVECNLNSESKSNVIPRIFEEIKGSINPGHKDVVKSIQMLLINWI